MSHDALLVFAVVGIMLFLMVLMAGCVVLIVRSAVRITETQHRHEEEPNREKEIYRGREYEIEVEFSDREASARQYAKVVEHFVKDGVLMIYFSTKHSVYIPTASIKRMMTRPTRRETDNEYEVENNEEEDENNA